MNNYDTSENRIIFFHLQSSSARIRFLYFKQRQSVLGFDSLPKLSVLLDVDKENSDVLKHEAELKGIIKQQMGDSFSEVNVIPEFYHSVDAPHKTIEVSLVRFTDIDPPFDLAKKYDAEFRELPSLRMVHPVELNLLKNAYQLVIG